MGPLLSVQSYLCRFQTLVIKSLLENSYWQILKTRNHDGSVHGFLFGFLIFLKGPIYFISSSSKLN